ncbi:MAG TPA: hypothetical protein VKZ97_09450, partial [Flavobacteriaceae bacterium]|nr:hypothetical protein [Flavobacteriaceae bacterium]
MLRYFVCFVLLNTVGFSQSHLEKTPTQIADSLDKIGEYTTSLKYRDLALNNSHSNSYSKYLKAKWHYTKACIHELTGGIENHKKAVEHSLKAKDLIEQIQTKTTHYYIFKH